MVPRFPLSREDCFPQNWPHRPHSAYLTEHSAADLLALIADRRAAHRLRQEAIFALFATYLRPGVAMGEVLRLFGPELWERHLEVWHIDFQTGPPHALPLDEDGGSALLYARLLPFEPQGYHYQIDLSIKDLAEPPASRPSSRGDLLLHPPPSGTLRALAFHHPFYLSEVHDDTGVRAPRPVRPAA